MSSTNPDLASLERESASDDAEVRGRALERLLLRARKDASVHTAALRAFRGALPRVQEPYTGLNVARGLELLAPPAEARAAWLALLDHPHESVAAAVALSVPNASYAPALVDLLERRTGVDLRESVVRALGRLGDRRVLPALVRQLGDARVRAHTVEALRELGDARAIPHLEPLLTDSSDAWREDNHGPMLRVCDLAKDAIATLRRAS